MTWKKTLIIIGAVVTILGAPILAISNPAMDFYQSRIDQNPKTSFNRWLQLRVCGGLCYKTMRPERSVDAYRKFLENWGPEDPDYPFAWLRYANSLEDTHQNQAAEEQYMLIMEHYSGNAEMGELAEEAKRGILRVRYQKRK
jgi:tetratricopeptide (TPR) repeat protein